MHDLQLIRSLRVPALGKDIGMDPVNRRDELEQQASVIAAEYFNRYPAIARERGYEFPEEAASFFHDKDPGDRALQIARFVDLLRTGVILAPAPELDLEKDKD